ncbi:unnamed protein product, partial [Laminaria digitata]
SIRISSGTAKLPASASGSPATTTATTAEAAMPSSSTPVSVHWFRKGLRLHDNRALLEACDEADVLYPLFVVD